MRFFICAVAGFMLSLAWSAPVAAAHHAVVLQYHHFGSDTPEVTSVKLATFEQHLKYLEENDFTVLPLWDIVTRLREGNPLPERTVAITIDDAFISVYTEAYPRLKKRGYPFTVFVPTQAVDRGAGGYMTWKQMKEMKRSGASFASHGHTHAHLLRRKEDESDEQWARRISDDIRLSIDRLQEELGSNPKLFAYPYGEYSIKLKHLVKELGLVGVGQHSGPIGTESDFLALPRFPMGGVYSMMEQFAVKVRTLPFSVTKEDPEDPVLPDGISKPVLRLTLKPGDYSDRTLACYLGGGKLKVRWVDKENRVVEVSTETPLPQGRSRYNCTASHRDENRYFWYSHLWINNIYHSMD